MHDKQRRKFKTEVYDDLNDGHIFQFFYKNIFKPEIQLYDQLLDTWYDLGRYLPFTFQNLLETYTQTLQ